MPAKKFSEGKPKLSKIDPQFAEAMAHVLEMGDGKYGEANWMHGMPWSELVDSAERHIAKIKRGEFYDAESGQFHGAHVATCMMILGFYHRRGIGVPDLRFGSQFVTPGAGRYTCYQCSLAVDWLAPDSRCKSCTRLTPEEISGTGTTWATPPAPGSAVVRVDREDGPWAAGWYERCGRTLSNALERINRWADSVLPGRKPEMALQKLVMEELPELLNGNLDDPHEWADVAILVLDGMQLRGIDPVEAIHDKMAINETRQWEVNEHGILKHR
jgi:hypothetical protein